VSDRPQSEQHNPELGNLCFGLSRGEYAIDRDTHARIFEPLFDALDPNGAGYGVEWDNDVFEMHQYWWGDEEAPEAGRPNFRHKASGYEARWYKYPWRDSYCNQDLDALALRLIVAECVASLEGDGE